MDKKTLNRFVYAHSSFQNGGCYKRKKMSSQKVSFDAWNERHSKCNIRIRVVSRSTSGWARTVTEVLDLHNYVIQGVGWGNTTAVTNKNPHVF